jgi:hypothetical protein
MGLRECLAEVKEPQMGGRDTNPLQDGSATCGRSTLAILPKKSDVCTDAQPVLDPESVERLCRVWAEVGRAILGRRSK